MGSIITGTVPLKKEFSGPLSKVSLLAFSINFSSGTDNMGSGMGLGMGSGMTCPTTTLAASPQ